MIVIQIDLVREIGRVSEYKIAYQGEIFNTKLVENTFNYDEKEIENIPETVLVFVEKWIKRDLQEVNEYENNH